MPIFSFWFQIGSKSHKRYWFSVQIMCAPFVGRFNFYLISASGTQQAEQPLGWAAWLLITAGCGVFACCVASHAIWFSHYHPENKWFFQTGGSKNEWTPIQEIQQSGVSLALCVTTQEFWSVLLHRDKDFWEWSGFLSRRKSFARK